MKEIKSLNLTALIATLLVPFYYTYNQDLSGSWLIIFVIWGLEHLSYYKDEIIFFVEKKYFFYRKIFLPSRIASLLLMFFFFEQIFIVEPDKWYIVLVITAYTNSWFLKYAYKIKSIIYCSIFPILLFAYLIVNYSVSEFVIYSILITSIFSYVVGVIDLNYIESFREDIKRLENIGRN